MRDRSECGQVRLSEYSPVRMAWSGYFHGLGIGPTGQGVVGVEGAWHGNEVLEAVVPATVKRVDRGLALPSEDGAAPDIRLRQSQR